MTERFISLAHWPLLRRALLSAGRATASQRVSLVAAGCAFYATLALFPTITMLISLYGLVYNPQTVQPQLHYLQSFMPPAAFSLISDRIQSVVAQPAKGLGLSLLVSLGISLWSSSTGTKSVLNALSLAYHERETRGLIRFQLVALGMTLIAIIGTALAIAFLVFLPVALAFLGLSGAATALVGLIGAVVMVAFLALALGLLYRYGPAGAGRVFQAPGAAIATVLWLLASWAFGLYVGHFAAYSVVYGPLGALIGLMMWFYISAYVVLFGAEVNAALDREWRHYRLHRAGQMARS
ncbi:YihY/virulence factor BrkB family protein [Acidocella sp. KAb 2-4]|uniref:YihY/virulence factor BrkB family protein n=1 Tax=Acidocella sp. KAb 2-4 TaxID=2885158 RepID=UPI001D09010B|nr:YihY/virulence factor BrkB family protein [Acidocella sp. KAb 2-4]MCB5943383.1 YihY/virulence factor BrkB family protein [Acidocella sp. KAb 2-4]